MGLILASSIHLQTHINFNLVNLHRIHVPNYVFKLNMSNVCLGVNLRMDTKRTNIEKRLDHKLNNHLLTILDAIINMIGRVYMVSNN
jgi:hypothetical protein